MPTHVCIRYVRHYTTIQPARPSEQYVNWRYQKTTTESCVTRHRRNLPLKISPMTHHYAIVCFQTENNNYVVRQRQ